MTRKGKPTLQLSGWEQLPGTSRRYRNKRSGKTISRRDYDNKRLRKQGWKNRYEAETFRKTQTYRKARERLLRPKRGRKRTLSETDIFSPWAKFLHDIDWEQVDINWESIAIERELGTVDKSPDGVLARTLVMIGAREPDWSWDVGDTPSGVSATPEAR